MENLIKGNDENFETLIKSDKLTVVDFWAEWCGPCRTQLPILEEFAKANPDVQVVKLNVDENGEIANTYGVRSIPTILYFKNGVEVKKFVGLQQLSSLVSAKSQLV